jgi:hypothetical protein
MPAHDALAALDLIAERHPDWKAHEWIRHLNAYADWLSGALHNGWTLLGTQIKVCNKAYSYQGTLDQLWRDHDGVEVIVDLKAVTEGHCAKSTLLQLAAYDMGLGSTYNLVSGDSKPRLLMGLALRADGSYYEDVYTPVQVYKAKQDFRALATYYHVHYMGKEYRG